MGRKWNGDKMMSKWQKQLDKNLQAAAIELTNVTKKNLNTTPIGIKKYGQRRYATTPATRGAFPRKITGYLQRSLGWAKLAWSKVRVGTGVFYGGVHERGQHPFLLPSAKQIWQRLKRILTTPAK